VNSIHCVASYPGVPSVAPCRDGHLETCTHPDDHPGCRARLAERGFLCGRHFDRLEHAYARWPEFEARYRALEGERAVRHDTAGVRTTKDGHANLAPGFLAVDEARGFLETAEGHASLELWCGTQEGAAAAVQFAAAAERAYRDVQVEERPHRLRTTPCPRFGCSGVLIWSPPAWFEKPVQIICRDCGTSVSQDAFDYGEYA
jgi:hypothetical protein